MARIQQMIVWVCGLAFLFITCEKPDPPENPFDNYNTKQDTVKFVFNDPD